MWSDGVWNREVQALHILPLYIFKGHTTPSICTIYSHSKSLFLSLSIFAFLLTSFEKIKAMVVPEDTRHQPIVEMFISRRVLQQFDIWDGDKDRIVVANLLKNRFDPLVTARTCIDTCLGTYKDWKIMKDDNEGAAIADTFLTSIFCGR